MIDQLEEVLKTALSEQERQQLEELLRQTVVVTREGRAPMPEEETPLRAEEAYAAAPAVEMQTISTEEDWPLPLSHSRLPAAFSVLKQGEGQTSRAESALRSREQEDSWEGAQNRRGEENAPALEGARAEEVWQQLSVGGGVLAALLGLDGHTLSLGSAQVGRSRSREQGERTLPNSLYRRAVAALRSPLGGRGESAPVVIREEQAASAGLTARELDRAVRRDSRRYDGGMSIY